MITSIRTTTTAEYSISTEDRDVLLAADLPALECLIQLRSDDAQTGIEYRDCLIDYTLCPNKSCIKKLV